MGKKKVEDWQILKAIDLLCEKSQYYWEQRFGDPGSSPSIFRREEIQEKAQFEFEFEMSNSGFRSRLKKLVKSDELTVVRLDEKSPFYTLK